MVGLAFEVHNTYRLQKQVQSRTADSDISQLTELELKFNGVQPAFLDVIHYAFCYIGVLTGILQSQLVTIIWISY